MNILYFQNADRNGCSYVRNELPAKYLEQHGHDIRVVSEVKTAVDKGKTILDAAHIDWADVIVWSRNYDVDDKAIFTLMKYAYTKGKKNIYETDDDLLNIDKTNNAFDVLERKAKQVKMMCSLSHVITTTTPELAMSLKQYNPCIAVIPNGISTEHYKPRRKKDRLRIGWAGGSSHFADLLEVIDVIRDLKKEHDFDFVLFGLTEKDLKETIERKKKEHHKKLNGLKDSETVRADWYNTMLKLDEALDFDFEHHPFVPIDEYPDKLRKLSLDIGICPLVDTPFNRRKSAIKFYEYALVGTATLASDIPPYKAEVAYRAKNRYNKFKKKLEKLIVDEKFRKELAKQQRDWVTKNRTIEACGPLWLSLYEGIHKQSRN